MWNEFICTDKHMHELKKRENALTIDDILDVDMFFPVRIGQETLLEDNLPDDEIEIELAPIAVQLAYVQQVS